MAHLVVTRLEPGTLQDYRKECTGRCKPCNIRYIWDKALGSVKDMICPNCYKHLSRTTHLFKGTTQRLSSPYSKEH